MSAIQNVATGTAAASFIASQIGNSIAGTFGMGYAKLIVDKQTESGRMPHSRIHVPRFSEPRNPKHYVEPQVGASHEMKFDPQLNLDSGQKQNLKMASAIICFIYSASDAFLVIQGAPRQPSGRHELIYSIARGIFGDFGMAILAGIIGVLLLVSWKKANNRR